VPTAPLTDSVLASEGWAVVTGVEGGGEVVVEPPPVEGALVSVGVPEPLFEPPVDPDVPELEVWPPELLPPLFELGCEDEFGGGVEVVWPVCEAELPPVDGEDSAPGPAPALDEVSTSSAGGLVVEGEVASALG
jgi:hypothetical protein